MASHVRWPAIILTPERLITIVFKMWCFLLTDLFENFGNEFTDSFLSHPAHYFSTPCCCWYAMLRFTDAELKLISDIEKYQFIENVIWAGIWMNCKSYRKVKNIFLISYDPAKPSLYMMYLDANDIYWHSVMQSFFLNSNIYTFKRKTFTITRQS